MGARGAAAASRWSAGAWEAQHGSGTARARGHGAAMLALLQPRGHPWGWDPCQLWDRTLVSPIGWVLVSPIGHIPGDTHGVAARVTYGIRAFCHLWDTHLMSPMGWEPVSPLGQEPVSPVGHIPDG